MASSISDSDSAGAPAFQVPVPTVEENETSIPFQRGLFLGQSLDVTRPPFLHDPACQTPICPDDVLSGVQGPTCLPNLVALDVQPNVERVNRTTAQFSIVESLTDVCEILQLPLEYVLKVKANWILDDVVAACLRGADNPNTICITFRIQYLEQKQYLPESVKLNLEALHLTRVGNRTKAASDADSLPATLCVRAIEFGNELVVICRISISDEDELSSLSEEMTDELGNCKGLLGNEEIRNLDTFAKSLDKKLRRAFYREVMKLEIEYCTYSNLHQCPATLTDMMEVIKEFLRQCEAWTDLYKHPGPRHYDDSPMMKKSESITGEFVTENHTENPPQIFGAQYGNASSAGVDQCVASQSDQLHHMRAIIQPLECAGNEMGTFRRITYPKTGPSKLRSLYELHLTNTNDIETLQEFLASDFFISAENRGRGKRLLDALLENQENISATIKTLDFVTAPTDEELKSLSESLPTTSVAEYIKTVTRLPPGKDVELILIGKTGHGKSSTGNSILGRTKFIASGNPTSVTVSSVVGWANVDERVIKVVDTPGVCDTNFESDEESMEHSAHLFNEAIAFCPEGFHALLIVFRYGMRLTKEEKKAIIILKTLFGEDIIKDHCVCVMTHGDNFESENEGQQTFDEWCKSESGDLKEIFEECQYRCVLFDNKTQNSEVRQRQVVELVYHVDDLNSTGTRYTNKLFELASSERKRIIQEQKAPELNENIMRGAQLIGNELDDICVGLYEGETNQFRLEKFKRLKNIAGEMKTGTDGPHEMGTEMEMLANLASDIETSVLAVENGTGTMDEQVPQLRDARDRLLPFLPNAFGILTPIADVVLKLVLKLVEFASLKVRRLLGL